MNQTLLNGEFEAEELGGSILGAWLLDPVPNMAFFISGFTSAVDDKIKPTRYTSINDISLPLSNAYYAYSFQNELSVLTSLLV